MKAKSIKEINEQRKRIFTLLDENFLTKHGYIDLHLKQTRQSIYDKVIFFMVCYTHNIVKKIGYPITGNEKIPFADYQLTKEQREQYKERFSNL